MIPISTNKPYPERLPGKSMLTLDQLIEFYGYPVLTAAEVKLVHSQSLNWSSLEGEIILRKCLKSFPAYLQAANFGYKITAYHYSLAANQQRDFETGPNMLNGDRAQRPYKEDPHGKNDYGIILLAAPPQTGKSLSISESFPAWVATCNPRIRIICLGYSSTFATRFGRRNRDKVAALGPVLSRGKMKLHDKVQSSDNWEMMLLDEMTRVYHSSNGGMVTTGMDGQTTGNGFRKNTPVLTTDGWTTHGDLKIGDYVFNHLGQPVKVVNVLPDYEVPEYEIVIRGGETFYCSDVHKWPVFYQKKNRDGYWDDISNIVEAKDIENPKIVRRLNNGQPNGFISQRSLRQPRIPVHQPLDLPDRVQLIDPYKLGLWLGDGFSKNGRICGLIEDLKEYGCTDIWENKRDIYQQPFGEAKLISDTLLNKYFLLHNKRIPLDYMLGSYQQRLSLLQGIVDTDGHIAPRDGMCEITFASKSLADDVCKLVRTLGFKVSVYHYETKHRISFWPDGVQIARLKRKQINITDVNSNRTKYHYIDSAKPNGKIQLGNCITVEGGIYLIGETLVPTHNTGNYVQIDDPIKNMQEAMSEVIVLRNVEIFQSAIETRLRANPGSMLCVMNTRWVTNDTHGWLRKHRKKYIVGDYSYAALCTEDNIHNDPLRREVGEGICPEMGLGAQWAENVRESYEAGQGAHVFRALYQQEPSNEKGNLFRDENWQEYEIEKVWKDFHKFDKIYLSIDATFKDLVTSDFVAMEITGIKQGNSYLRYLVRKQMDLPDTIDKIIEMCKKFPEIEVIYIEDKANGPGITQVMRKWRKKLKISERDVPAIVPIEPEGGKYSRAQTASVYQRDGRCYIPCEKDAHKLSSEEDFVWDEPGLSYTQCYRQELGTFPFAGNDDLVDSFSQGIKRSIGLLSGEEKAEKKIMRFTRYSNWWPEMWADYKQLKEREAKDAFVRMHGAPMEWKPKEEM